MQKTSRLYDWLYDNRGERTLILQGGTSSTKTYSVLQFLYSLATYAETPLLISIVAETMPALRRGAMRDFFKIVGSAYVERNHNRSDAIYKTGLSQIEFFGADNEDKVRGARRDVLYLNEANNIRKTVRDQLEPRTRILEIIDFNPTAEFWAHNLVGNKGVSYDISTYKDNPFLEEEIIRSIESRRLTDPEWWRVFGEGKIGSVEGRIYKHFEQIERMPNINTTLGIDWGYNDPTAIVETGIAGDSMYIRELLYQRGLTTPLLEKEMERIGIRKNKRSGNRWIAGDLLIADSSRPEIIREMQSHGWNIKAKSSKNNLADKIQAIEYIKRYKLKVTKNSINWIKEARNYKYQENKKALGEHDRYLNAPIETYDHLMDATLYSNNDRRAVPQIAISAKQRF